MSTRHLSGQEIVGVWEVVDADVAVALNQASTLILGIQHEWPDAIYTVDTALAVTPEGELEYTLTIIVMR